MGDNSATWVYAVTRDPDPVLLRAAGVGGEPVRAIGDAELAAVAGSVDANAFGEAALERRLSDPDELEAIARAHHQVIEVVAAARPTLPLRLATVYRDDDRVRALLTQRRAEFGDMLRWLDGRTEYGVKVWADPEVMTGGDKQEQAGQTMQVPGGRSADVGGDGATGRGPTAGTAYLLRRRANLTARADGWQHGAARGEEIHAALGRLAVAARRHAPQDPRLTGNEDGWMVLNGAYLVDSGRGQEFAATAGAMVSGLAGFQLDVTGPWPAYSFSVGRDQ
ncbi:MAG TPA: GvpL/GvpF family gas vesicle protein [Streptosporangiaceae bacterium]|nr:GvpL/GvpF family gas vesicle protein [Streptosporangiaceae bacterium]